MIGLISKAIHHVMKPRLSSAQWRACFHGTVQRSSKIKRPPVVTIMGHVDHGKTTLLDNLRNSEIVKQEFGGITQHIGAFVVPFKQASHNELVTFIDTPGHAAFAAMRQRGANVTDIVILVVACEDGVMEQTVESVKYAKESEVPIIVAVNKIDKFENEAELRTQIERLKDQLIVHDLITEDRGGDVQLIKISALKDIGVEDLKEAILAQAETLELYAEVDCPVAGRVIESSIDPHRGKICTVLVQKGFLNKGDILLAGDYNWAKVRALFDERNQLKQSCGPSMPVQITGWREADTPSPGDLVVQVPSEADAKRAIAIHKQKASQLKAQDSIKLSNERYQSLYKIYKEKLVEKQMSEWKRKPTLSRNRHRDPILKLEEKDELKINIVLKCDVDGSLEAILDLFDTYDRDKRQPVKLDVMHFGVGSITENDLLLASSFENSVIYGFNVKATNQDIMLKAKRENIDMKFFNVIYHLIDDLKSRLDEKMPEYDVEVDLGQATIIQEFIIKEGSVKTRVAGCRCEKGVLKKSSFFKLIRNKELVCDKLEVKTLRHMKDDQKEIEKGRECGISFIPTQTPIEFRPGDQLVSYEIHKEKKKLRWDLKGFN